MAKLNLVQGTVPPSDRTPRGSYYIRKRKSGWALYHQEFVGDVRKNTLVKPLAYQELGFKSEWTYDEARKRCKQLNKEKTLIQSAAREAANRLVKMKSIDEVLFPSDRIAQFQRRMEQENEGSAHHLKKLFSHFKKVQSLCKDLQILPSDYKANEKIIYKWFAQNKVSLEYTQKLVSLLNRWGIFCSRLDGQFFEPIRTPRGISRENIRESHEGKSGVRTESLPISPELLAQNKEKLSVENYNFLFVTVWFGLRPSEVMGSEVVIQKNVDGLDHAVLYQGKLRSIEKSKRYKAIPLLFEQQKEAVRLLQSKELKKPTYKTMRKVFGNGYGLYGGRKNFTDMMLDQGYDIKDVSLWMGHTSIETTWGAYKRKNLLDLPSPKKK